MIKPLFVMIVATVFAFTQFQSLYSSSDHSIETDQLYRGIDEIVISRLINEGDGSISSIGENGEIYFNADCLTLNEAGIFLETENGEALQIPFLSMDERGYFSIISSSHSYTTIYPVIKCWNCGLPFSPSFFNKGKCPNCGEQN